jgi:hypothetical protein
MAKLAVAGKPLRGFLHRNVKGVAPKPQTGGPQPRPLALAFGQFVRQTDDVEAGVDVDHFARG